MILYKGNWVQDGNTYHFEESECKCITVNKNISYHAFFRVVYHILQQYPIECSILMKYAFSSNILTSLIQLRDDGDVKFFIRLNCTDNKLPTPLGIIVDKRFENNVKSMFVHGSGHVNDGLIESLNVVGDENITKFNDFSW